MNLMDLMEPFKVIFSGIKTVFAGEAEHADVQPLPTAIGARQTNRGSEEIVRLLKDLPTNKMFDRYREVGPVLDWVSEVHGATEPYAKVAGFVSTRLRNSLQKCNVCDWKTFAGCTQTAVSGVACQQELLLVKRLLGLNDETCVQKKGESPYANRVIPLVQKAAVAYRSHRTGRFIESKAVNTYGDLCRITEHDVMATKNCGKGVWQDILKMKDMGLDESLFASRLSATAYKSLSEYILGAWKMFSPIPEKGTMIVLRTSMGLLDAERYWGQAEIAIEMGYDKGARASVQAVEQRVRDILFAEAYAGELFGDFVEAVSGIFKQMNGVCDVNVLTAKLAREFDWELPTKWSVYNLCAELKLPIEKKEARADDFRVLTWRGWEDDSKYEAFVQQIVKADAQTSMTYSRVRAGFVYGGADLSNEEYVAYGRRLLEAGGLNPRKKRMFNAAFECKSNLMSERKLLLKQVLLDSATSGEPALTKEEACKRCESRMPKEDWNKVFQAALSNGDLDGNGCKIIPYGTAKGKTRGKPATLYTLNIIWKRDDVLAELQRCALMASKCLKEHSYVAITLDRLWQGLREKASCVPPQCAYFLLRDYCADLVQCACYPFVQLLSAAPIKKDERKKVWSEAVRSYFQGKGVSRIKDADIKLFVEKEMFYDCGTGVPLTNLEKDDEGFYVVG